MSETLKLHQNETKEKRHLGAMLFLVDGNGSVWVLEDESKLERAAGLYTPLPVYGLEKRWNVPAGGVQEGEKARAALAREFEEEVKGLSLPKDLEITPVNSPVFVVDQFKPTAVHQIGVTLWEAKVDSDSEFYHQLSERGKWVAIEKLSSLFGAFDSGNAYADESYEYRPQLLLAAALYLNKLSEGEIIEANQELLLSGYYLSKRAGIEVKNGLFTPDGKINLDSTDLMKEHYER